MHEGTARRRPSTRQGERPPGKPALRTLGSQTSGLWHRGEINARLLFELPALWSSVMVAKQTNTGTKSNSSFPRVAGQPSCSNIETTSCDLQTNAPSPQHIWACVTSLPLDLAIATSPLSPQQPVALPMAWSSPPLHHSVCAFTTSTPWGARRVTDHPRRLTS